MELFQVDEAGKLFISPVITCWDTIEGHGVDVVIGCGIYKADPAALAKLDIK